jgi:hypothetical protein
VRRSRFCSRSRWPVGPASVPVSSGGTWRLLLDRRRIFPTRYERRPRTGPWCRSPRFLDIWCAPVRCVAHVGKICTRARCTPLMPPDSLHTFFEASAFATRLPPFAPSDHFLSLVCSQVRLHLAAWRAWAPGSKVKPDAEADRRGRRALGAGSARSATRRAWRVAAWLPLLRQLAAPWLAAARVAAPMLLLRRAIGRSCRRLRR